MKRSIRKTYVLLLFLVIQPVLISFLVFNYMTISSEFDDNALIALEQSKLNLTDHIVMTEKNYELIGEQYQKLLIDASKTYKEEYEKTKDIDRIDYEQIKRSYDNLIELYVIDSNAVIIKSTYPDAIDLDFKEISLDFVDTIKKIRLGDETIISNITEDLTNGNLRKWSYIPTSDHRYVLEIGVNDQELAKYVRNIDYRQLFTDTQNINPLIEDIKIYSSSYTELSSSTLVVDPKVKKIIRNVFRNKQPHMEYDDNGALIREYFFINSLANRLNDTEKVISITYDYSKYYALLNNSIYTFIVFFILYTFIILSIIYFVTKKVITEPINRVSRRMHLFAKNRKYNKLEIQNDDEIGHLIEAYNHLVDELHSTSKSQKYYKKKSHTDPLTGLYNRHYIMESFQKHCMQLRDDGKAFSFLIWDIDHFKNINDTYGHPIGDEVLQNVATTLSNLIGDDGVVVRYGGEEFVAIVSMRNKEVVALAEKLRVLIESEPQTSHRIEVTISAGIAFSDEIARYEDNKKLIPIADKRLYMAKKSGRNRIVYPEL